jgi:hypothetical protein
VDEADWTDGADWADWADGADWTDRSVVAGGAARSACWLQAVRVARAMAMASFMAMDPDDVIRK